MKKLLFAFFLIGAVTTVCAQEPLYRLKGHGDLITGVAFADDSKTLASAGSWEDKVYIWNVAGAALTKTITVPNQCMSVNYLSKDKLIATSGNDVLIIDIDKGEITKTLSGHTETAWHVSINKAKTLIASSGWDNTCIIWDVKKEKKKKTLTGHTSYINRSAFSNDGKQIATASEDTRVKIWDVKKGKLVLTLTDHTSAATTLTYSPDGKYLATGGDDGMVYIYDATTFELVFTLPEQKDKVRSVAFSPNGKVLAVGCGSEAKEVNIYSVGKWTRVTRLIGPDSFVNHLRFSPDGKYLAAACSDKIVYIWDALKFSK